MEYVKLNRLGRNLRVGDEIIVGENLDWPYREGRVRVTDVRKVRHNYRYGQNEWIICHTPPVAGNLRAHLWSGPHWGTMRVEHDTDFDIMRPRAI